MFEFRAGNISVLSTETLSMPQSGMSIISRTNVEFEMLDDHNDVSKYSVVNHDQHTGDTKKEEIH